MSYNVYISATSKDLAQERLAAHEAVKKLHLFPVGMEYYEASDERPLSRCVKDASECAVYVGLIAWRYGFVPPESEGGLSVTHSEYRAARESGAKCLIFLSPELDGWDREQDADLKSISDFRNEVRKNHIVATFQDHRALAVEVIAALKVEEQRMGRVPKLLPFTCDRTDHYSDLKGNLVKARQSGVFVKPRVCIVHGQENQAHSQFIDCLVEREIQRIMEVGSSDNAMRNIQLYWGSPDSEGILRDRLTSQLAEKAKCPTAGSIKEIWKSLEKHPYPVLIHVQFPAASWESFGDSYLKAFVDLFLDDGPEVRCWPAVVILWMAYRTPEKLTLWQQLAGEKRRRERRRKQISDALEGLREKYSKDARFLLLPELANVRRDEVVSWANSKDVKRYVRESPIEPDVRKVFDKQNVDELAMEPLAGDLRKILARKAV